MLRHVGRLFRASVHCVTAVFVRKALVKGKIGANLIMPSYVVEVMNNKRAAFPRQHGVHVVGSRTCVCGRFGK